MTKIPVIILSASSPHKGIQNVASIIIHETITALDWNIHNFDSIGINDIYCVVGYDKEYFENNVDGVNIVINDNWENTNSAYSFLLALEKITDFSNGLYVSYGDVVLRNSVLSSLDCIESDVGVTVSNFDKNVEIIKNSDGESFEFVGLIKLSPKACEYIKNNIDKDDYQKKILSDFTSHILKQPFTTNFLNVGNNFCQLKEQEDLVRFVMGTKSETLLRLESLVKKSHICGQICVVKDGFDSSPQSILNTIKKQYSGGTVIVRSSSSLEDGWEESNAGGFKSVLNVSLDDKSLTEAIDSVFQSYGTVFEKSQVLIQEMITNVTSAGVIFTSSLNGAPYYVINYDKTGGTDLVTSGMGDDVKNVWVSKSISDVELLNTDPIVAKLIMSVREIEKILKYSSLDIEFSLKDEKIYIFQVRPLVNSAGILTSDVESLSTLRKAQYQWKKHQTKKTVFGVMPDWNPAEIIGLKPAALSYSIYEHIITNEIWAIQREQFGYKALNDKKLLESFAGIPYVNVRKSAMSFIPNSIDAESTKIIVDSYVKRFSEHKSYHDKWEFEIAFTAWSPDIKTRIESRYPTFSNDINDSLTQGLKNITVNAIKSVDSFFIGLEETYEKCSKISQNKNDTPFMKVQLLLESVKPSTLQFSHLARCGFIAIDLLRYLVRSQQITQQQYNCFLQSVETVAGQFEKAIYAVTTKTKTIGELLTIYGHLRPGTYDIMQKPYYKDVPRYIQPLIDTAKDTHKIVKHTIDFTALAADFGVPITTLESFLYSAISGREYAKLLFTKNISASLDLIEDWAVENSISVSDIQHLDVNVFMLGNFENILKNIQENRHKHILLNHIELPMTLTCEDDFVWHEKLKGEPNYITDKNIRQEVIYLNSTIKSEDLTGKIVVIESADPGYDWIFGSKISGLVTLYGGSNSHMAIRASELSIPAIIGAGSVLFEKIIQAEIIQIDCLNKKIEIIR